MNEVLKDLYADCGRLMIIQEGEENPVEREYIASEIQEICNKILIILTKEGLQCGKE